MHHHIRVLTRTLLCPRCAEAIDQLRHIQRLLQDPDSLKSAVRDELKASGMTPLDVDEVRYDRHCTYCCRQAREWTCRPLERSCSC